MQMHDIGDLLLSHKVQWEEQILGYVKRYNAGLDKYIVEWMDGKEDLVTSDMIEECKENLDYAKGQYALQRR
jgi:hypothetical protein